MTLKAIAVNGSPRKHHNTATLLNDALEGARAAGAASEIIHLYDLDYKGCTSCFACKLKSCRSIGRCATKDGLTELLDKIAECDVLILGSPIYLGSLTGEMHSFFERLIFPCISYDVNCITVFNGKIASGFIYTMNVSKPVMEQKNYMILFESNKKYLEYLNGPSEYLLSMDTYQFDDYAQYKASEYNEAAKANVRRSQFSCDRRQAFELGFRLVQA